MTIMHRLWLTHAPLIKARLRRHTVSMSSKGNAEKRSVGKPRRAGPVTHSGGVVLLANGARHSLRRTPCRCTRQTPAEPMHNSHRFLER